MRNMLFPAVSAFALLCAVGPLTVQTSLAQTAMSTLSSAQQMDYNSWSTAQRAAYDAWPSDTQAYYWTLSLNQMHGWWKLTDVQRSQIMAMTPVQRASSWVSIEAQLAGQAAAAAPMPAVVQPNPVGSSEMPSATPPNPVSANMPVPPAMPADSTYHAGPYKGALSPPPPEAMNKVYPVCTKILRDSCRNRGGK
jgi:hypothetical protein